MYGVYLCEGYSIVGCFLMDNILSGIEDVPAIADDKCGVCGAQLTKDNFSDWFIFVKNDGQMYQVPCCNPCLAERDEGGSWACPKCSHENDAMAIKCFFCDAAAPKA